MRKHDHDKPRMTLVPQRALRDVAVVMTHGAKKYGDHDYLDPSNDSDVPRKERYIDAALRHINEERLGSNADHETGKDPLAHAAASLMIALEIKHQERDLTMAERKRPPFTYAAKRDSLKIGCAPLTAVLLLCLLLAGCVSRSVVRLNETTPDGTFSIVYRNIGDARSEQQVDYSGADWRLRVGSASDITSPAHEEAARQLTGALAAFGEAVGAVGKWIAAL